MNQALIINQEEIIKTQDFLDLINLILPGKTNIPENILLLSEFIEMFPESQIILRDSQKSKNPKFSIGINDTEEMEGLPEKLLTRAGLVRYRKYRNSRFYLALNLFNILF